MSALADARTPPSATAPVPVAWMPRQIPLIIANEGCERFSFYGMRNILTIFLASAFFANLPGRRASGGDGRRGEAGRDLPNLTGLLRSHHDAPSSCRPAAFDAVADPAVGHPTTKELPMRALPSLLLALFSCALPARADVLPPGSKSVSHRLVIERSDAWDGGQRIVAAPVRGFGGTLVVEPGVPFSFSTKYGTRLYVVPSSEELPERIDKSWSASHLSATIPVLEVGSAPVASPLESLTTTLTVRALDRDRFELAVLEERSERDPWLLAGWVTAFAAGVLGLVLIRRLRSRTSVS